MSEQIGPNVRRLIACKMAILAIPAGSGKDSFRLGLDAFTNRGKFSSMAAEASAWVQAAIAVMKTAPDNPYGNDDEAIAGAILEGIEQRKKDNAGKLQ
jgi:hypothetical protein